MWRCVLVSLACWLCPLQIPKPTDAAIVRFHRAWWGYPRMWRTGFHAQVSEPNPSWERQKGNEEVWV